MDTLLIIEDDIGIQKQLKWHLTDYNLIFATTRQEGITALRRFEPKVVTLDLGLPPDQTNASEGLQTLKEILSLNPDTKVIVITGNDNKKYALKAIEDGAHDYYQKPIDSNILNVIIDRAFKLAKLELESLKQQQNHNISGIIGCSEQVQGINQTIKRAALENNSILIVGEPGTGKKTVSHKIHMQSQRCDHPIIVFKCALFKPDAIESHLFGDDIDGSTKGVLEEANNGTIVIDEVSLLPLRSQLRLLQFLRTKIITYSNRDVKLTVSVKVICTSKYILEEKVNDNTFISELYLRLSLSRIIVPALRERSEDILILAQDFLQQERANNKCRVNGFSNDAIQSLCHYHWPGNLTELNATIKSAIRCSRGKLITKKDLSFTDKKDQDDTLPVLSLRSARENVERKAILQAVTISNGNISKAAGLLGITRPTLYTLVEKHGISLGKIQT
ncbi:sigma 54-interacting transcriptional regulator [Photobacterium lutimaris]|uniref:Sigma-54-dependent Fis family transcriptional regulator n=1 Tax=Photobacterium lutimaris TaxID=388278 RepID=A0A2T3J2R7_9GAMM|nr:sigma 54-interacting transcriptional regulator [Photobacterium lutimaris]PSU35592.1 sigma-54-dependent Fis family transcriptional regulator [Photobacterium lutimaris]TDR78645.1 two component Fis family sigma54 specific transcriptional regulator [Photobacterium lutimaris]